MKRTTIILLGVFVLAAVGGVFLFRGKKYTTTPVVSVTEQQKQDQTQARIFEPVAGEGGWVWYPVPELGIEIKVNKDIAGELIYQVKEFQTSEERGKYAQFTTKRLIGIGEKNGLGTYTEAGYECNIGTFVLSGINQEDLDMIKKSGSYVDDKNTTAIIFRSPQSYCSQDASDGNYEEYLSLNWLKRENGIRESLQKTIRGVK